MRDSGFPETDEELRRRLRYVAADGAYLTRLIEISEDKKLDAIAECYNLRRLKF